MRPSQIPTVAQCEQELDQALRDLRQLDGSTNTVARSSIEYRIGALRRRRDILQDAPSKGVVR